jgi:hypothetical protein
MCLGYDFASKGNTFQQNHADTADVGAEWKPLFYPIRSTPFENPYLNLSLILTLKKRGYTMLRR